MRSSVKSYKVVFAALLLSAAATYAAPQEPKTRAEVEQVVARLWESRAYKELDALEVALTGKLTLSGFSLAEMLHQAIEAQVESDSTEPEIWKVKEEAELGWTKAAPTSALAHVTYADALRHHGYAIRGTEYASHVTPAQWRGFREYSARAKAYLVENRHIASASPTWHLAMLGIAQSTGSPEVEYRELMENALARFPRYFRLYVAGVDRYTPKWGGAPGDVAACIDKAVARLPEPAITGSYARLYSVVYQGEPDVDARRWADCSRWLQGVQSITNQFATPYNFSQAALASYLCDNRTLARVYFGQIGAEPLPAVWGEGLSAAEKFRRARAWALSTLTQ